MKRNRKLLLIIIFLSAIQARLVYGQDTIRIKDAIWYPSSSKISKRGEHIIDSIFSIVKQRPLQKIEVVIVEYTSSESSKCYAKPRAKSIMSFFINCGIKEEVLILKYNCKIKERGFLEINSLPYLFYIVY